VQSENYGRTLGHLYSSLRHKIDATFHQVLSLPGPQYFDFFPFVDTNLYGENIVIVELWIVIKQFEYENVFLVFSFQIIRNNLKAMFFL